MFRTTSTSVRSGGSALQPGVRRRITRIATALVLAASACVAPAATLVESIETSLRATTLAPWVRPHSPTERAIAEAVYAERGFAPLWLSAEPPHRPTQRAWEAVRLMAAAQEKGLQAADYGVAWLQAALDPGTEPLDGIRFDTGLTLAFIRYLSDVGYGRIDPATLGYDLPQQQRRAGLPAAVRTALASVDPAAAVATLEPGLPFYRRLIGWLADYRRLAAAEPLPPVPPPPVGQRKVSPGDAWTGVAVLRAHLVRHGDLAAAPGNSTGSTPNPTDSPPNPTDMRYDGEVVGAVRRFQSRHGLDIDGVLGARTFEALAVTPASRARQIELSLERLRWLGDLPGDRFVAVNIPQFRLWAVSGRGAGSQPLDMRVVVGATVNGTPVFVDSIEAVEFNPYWNVPPSIASKELFPKLARSSTYLASQDMELLGGAGLTGRELQRALAAGKARIRQKPGVLNALGRVKFVMPNRHNVYLHDTPARQLFERSRRDFSHGCIRLERPLDLVEFVMRDLPAWDSARVADVVAAGRNLTVPIRKPVPVLIFYSTVGAGPDGRPQFAHDLYGLDAKLDAVLSAEGRPFSAVAPRTR